MAGPNSNPRHGESPLATFSHTSPVDRDARSGPGCGTRAGKQSHKCCINVRPQSWGVVPMDSTRMKTKRTVLTREERDVLILAALRPGGRHLSNSEIGERLSMSVNRVKTLLHQACVKLDAHNRNEAFLFAQKRGELCSSEYCSLDELAETLSSLGPDMLRRIAHLVRQKLEHGHLPGKDEQIIPTDRRQDAILTKRERDVLILVGRGLTNVEIADSLYISVDAVRTFLNRACNKLGACKRADAVVLALNQREIGIGEIFSVNELAQILAPWGAESVEKMAQLLNLRGVEQARHERDEPHVCADGKAIQLRGEHSECDRQMGNLNQLGAVMSSMPCDY
ncbi:MAG: LuxR family transcriptional regulator [Chloroflexota bacterium]|nr:MAG: LuxR family transcriptional regulator [Chloroflexota bacterium]